jgi:hypothetical protein
MVNSLSCAKVKPRELSDISLGAASTALLKTDHPMANVMSGIGMLTNPTSKLTTADDDNDGKPCCAVKMEVLDDFFGYGWDESTASAAVAAASNPFSSLLSNITPLSPPSSTVASSRCTVKVPLASEADLGSPLSYVSSMDTTFSPPAPNMASVSLAVATLTTSLTGISEVGPLRVIIPSPLPGPDTTSGSPASVALRSVSVSATTPSSASSSSSKKTVFTAKGM